MENHIPKTIDENRIFIRKDTGTESANKYDIDFMYYDRKNVVPDYHVIIDAIKIDFGNYINRNEAVQFVIFFSIENLGKRPIAINNITLRAKQETHQVDFNLEGKLTNSGIIAKHSPKDMIIKSGELQYINELIFVTEGTLNRRDKKEFIRKSEFIAILQLANNKILHVKINHDD